MPAATIVSDSWWSIAAPWTEMSGGSHQIRIAKMAADTSATIATRTANSFPTAQ